MSTSELSPMAMPKKWTLWWPKIIACPTSVRANFPSPFSITILTLYFHIAIGIVRSPKDAWYQQNKGFSGLMTNISVEAISLHGSSEPGSFAVLENVVRFTLNVDPPEAAKPNLPPGIKKGDSTGMIMLSTIWWNSDGKVARELEYGRLLWDDFDINAFNTW